MNKALQKWALKKQKTLKKWSKEYDELCKAERIKDNHILSFALDRDYVASIYIKAEGEEGMSEYLLNTEASFFRNGKWS